MTSSLRRMFQPVRNSAWDIRNHCESMKPVPSRLPPKHKAASDLYQPTSPGFCDLNALAAAIYGIFILRLTGPHGFYTPVHLISPACCLNHEREYGHA